MKVRRSGHKDTPAKKAHTVWAWEVCWIALDVDMEAEVGIEPAYTALQAAA